MVHNPATSRKRVVYKPTWMMTTGIGQAYTRIGAQRTSEMLGMTFCNGVVPAITGGKLRNVLEAVLDEIDFQMVEESVERIPGICNRRWFLAVPDSVRLMGETGTVTLKELEPVRPVAG